MGVKNRKMGYNSKKRNRQEINKSHIPQHSHNPSVILFLVLLVVLVIGILLVVFLKDSNVPKEKPSESAGAGSAIICTCSSCVECSNQLSSATCDIVQLKQNIVNSGTSVEIENGAVGSGTLGNSAPVGSGSVEAGNSAEIELGNVGTGNTTEIETGTVNSGTLGNSAPVGSGNIGFGNSGSAEIGNGAVGSGSNYCINNPSGFNNKILDCRKYKISGWNNTNQAAIYLSSKSGNTIKNCIISNNYYGIILQNSVNNVLENNNVSNSLSTGIYIIKTGNSDTNNHLNSNWVCKNGLINNGLIPSLDISVNSIYIQSDVGTNNTCDKTHNWKDGGYESCKNPCVKSTIPTSFLVNLVSPQNITYTSKDIWVNVTTSSTAAVCVYSLDGTTNVSMSGSGNSFYNLEKSVSYGQHKVITYCKKDSGTSGNGQVTGNAITGSGGVASETWNKSSLVYFTVSSAGPGPTPFTVNLVSPQNTTYTSKNIWVNVTTSKNAGACVYSLDGTTNVSMLGSGTSFYRLNSFMTEGQHRVIAYCSDATSATTVVSVNKSSLVYFTVSSAGPGPTPLLVNLVSPQNTTYTSSNIWVNVTTSRGAISCMYSLDGRANVSMSVSGMANSAGVTSFYGLISSIAEGQHNILAYCSDEGSLYYTVVSVNKSSLVYFTVSSAGPGPTPLLVNLVSPQNTTYDLSPIWFNVTTSKNAGACVYSLDETANASMSGSETSFYILGEDLTEGQHDVIAYCIDALGESINSSSLIYFTIRSINPRSNPFSVNLVSPQNTTYDLSPIWFNVTTSSTAAVCVYSLDGIANVSMYGSGTLFYRLDSSMNAGQHNAVAYCSDALGASINGSSLVYFTINPLAGVPCIETDDGEDYNEFGNCTDVNGIHEDTCDGNSLTEYFCDSNVNNNPQNSVLCVSIQKECSDYCDEGRCKDWNEGNGGSCAENWACSNWGFCLGGQQSRTCTDLTECGTTHNTPRLTQICTSGGGEQPQLSPCTEEDWQCSEWSVCSDAQQTRACEKINQCDSLMGISKESTQSCVNKEEPRGLPLWVILAIAAVLVIAIVVLILIVTAKNKNKPDTHYAELGEASSNPA